VLDYVNHEEAVKQWATVLGLSQAPVTTTQNTPLSGWTKTTYGPNSWLEAFSAAGVPHDIRVQENTVLEFFKLNHTADYFVWGQGSPGK